MPSVTTIQRQIGTFFSFYPPTQFSIIYVKSLIKYYDQEFILIQCTAKYNDNCKKVESDLHPSIF